METELGDNDKDKKEDINDINNTERDPVLVVKKDAKKMPTE